LVCRDIKVRIHVWCILKVTSFWISFRLFPLSYVSPIGNTALPCRHRVVPCGHLVIALQIKLWVPGCSLCNRLMVIRHWQRLWPHVLRGSGWILQEEFHQVVQEIGYSTLFGCDQRSSPSAWSNLGSTWGPWLSTGQTIWFRRFGKTS